MKKKMIVSFLLVLVLCAIGVCGWKFYDANVDRSGWTEAGGYRDFHGNPVTGWQDIDGRRYYFSSDGVRVTHWQDIDGKRFYFSSDGSMATFWQDIDGKRYYFGESGAMKTLWQELEGNRHYFGTNGAMASGWLDIDGSRYYFDENGSMATGEQTLDGTVFCFRPDGILVTGWENGRYYFSDGGFAIGWQEIEGKRYCFDESGLLRTGWVEEGEDRYYLHSDGSAAVGPVEIDGRLWHFSPSGKQIYLVNSSHHISEDYSAEIVPVDGGRVASVMAQPLEQMLSDCRAAGLHPIIVSSYRTYWDQKYLYNNLIQLRGETGKLYSAEPNASEHQLGLAVDIVEYSYRTLNASQENTPTFRWFSEHCWEYGFIVRYPNGSTDITGIAYEPWHYRYVGVEAAMELKELGITLEEYLGAA